MKEPKANIWIITGYKGWNGYDGPTDDNVEINVIFDSRFEKEDVEDIMLHYWNKKYRSVAIKANILAENMPIAEINEILGAE